MTVPVHPMNCPGDEAIAAFVEGTLRPEERQEVVAHLATCEDCYAIYQGAADFYTLEREQTPATPEGSGSNVVRGGFRPSRYIAPFAAAAAAAAVVIYLYYPPVVNRRAYDRLLASVGELESRPIQARVSDDMAYAEAPPRNRGQNSAAQATSDMFDAAVVLTERVEDGKATPLQTRRAAIARLLLAEAMKAEDQAPDFQTPINMLESIQPRDTAVLIDLSAAYLARSGYGDDDKQYARTALKYAEEAWKTSKTPITAWNRALAIEEIDPRSARARAAWNDYLKLDSTSEWANEARTHLEPL